MFTVKQYINLVNSAIEEDRDGVFPWKRAEFSDDEIREKMQKLASYYKDAGKWKTRFSKERYSLPTIPLRDTNYRGKPCTIVSLPTDYLDWNILSDMFNEKQRMKARLVTKDECPYDYFFNHLLDLLPQDEDCIITPSEVREKLFEAKIECTSFRPNIMCSIVAMFNATKVLDFSSGWGDRLIAAIACDVEYLGIDPNVELQKGYQDMRKFFGVSDRRFTTLVGRAQDMDSLIEPERTFDLVFTSPPYFNYELYNGNEKDRDEMKNEGVWFETFLKPSLNAAWDKLDDEGHMAININQTLRTQTYVSKMIEHVSAFEDAQYLGVVSYVNDRTRKSPQPIFIWKKSIKIGTPFITVYEKTRMITMRAIQLSMNKAKPHPSVPLEELMYDSTRIAKYEIENGLVEDYVIQRQVSKGKFQRQNAKEMILPPS